MHVSTIFPSEKLDAQVFVCLSVGAQVLSVYRLVWCVGRDLLLTHCMLVPSSLQKCWLHRYSSVYRLVWCVGSDLLLTPLYVSAIFPSEMLDAQVLVLTAQVLFRPLGLVGTVHHPSRDVGFLVCHLPFRQVGCTHFDQKHCRIIIRTSLRNSRNSFRKMFFQSKIKYQRL